VGHPVFQALGAARRIGRLDLPLLKYRLMPEGGGAVRVVIDWMKSLSA
jgi:hypothetical protein